MFSNNWIKLIYNNKLSLQLESLEILLLQGIACRQVGMTGPGHSIG